MEYVPSLQSPHGLRGGPRQVEDVPEDEVVGEHPLRHGLEQRADLAKVFRRLDDQDGFLSHLDVGKLVDGSGWQFNRFWKKSP